MNTLQTKRSALLALAVALAIVPACAMDEATDEDLDVGSGALIGDAILRVQEERGGEIYDDINFGPDATRDGWILERPTYGGRSGYRCGFLSLRVGGRVVAVAQAEIYDQGYLEQPENDLYSVINSPGNTAGNEPCPLGNNVFTAHLMASAAERARSDGPGDINLAPGAMSVVVGTTTWRLPAIAPTVHADAQWSAGDEAGEALLWYLERDSGEYGIVARFHVAAVSTAARVVDTAFTR